MTLSSIRFGMIKCVEEKIYPQGPTQYRFRLNGNDVAEFRNIATYNDPTEVKLQITPNEGLQIQRYNEPPRPLSPQELAPTHQLVDNALWMCWKGHEMKTNLLNALVVSAARYLPTNQLLSNLIEQVRTTKPAPITEPTAV